MFFVFLVLAAAAHASERRGKLGSIMPWGPAALDIRTLEAELRAPLAEVRQVESVPNDGSTPAAAFALAAYINEVARDLEGFEQIIVRTKGDTKTILEADQFLDDETRAGIRRIEALFREWAPRWETRRVPENHPIVRAFPEVFRTYNDAVTRLVRTMVDSADALDARVSSDEAEDREADDWADRNGGKLPFDAAEEVVSSGDVRKMLFPDA